MTLSGRLVPIGSFFTPRRVFAEILIHSLKPTHKKPHKRLFVCYDYTYTS